VVNYRPNILKNFTLKLPYKNACGFILKNTSDGQFNNLVSSGPRWNSIVQLSVYKRFLDQPGCIFEEFYRGLVCRNLNIWSAWFRYLPLLSLDIGLFPTLW